MSLKRTFSVLAILMGATACDGHDVTLPNIDGNGIIHGRGLKATDSVAKSVVALVSEGEEGAALCTGSVLDEQTILTAAHCVEHAPKKMIVIFDNKIKDAKKENIRIVDNYVQNPKWEKSKNEAGDIAIVHFTGGVPEGVQLVKLASKKFKPAEGSQVVMAGFGMSNASKESGGGTLRETKTTIVGASAPDKVATDGRTSSVCFGDSGGPAFSEVDGELVQWGVAHSVLNKQCNETSLHTNVIGYESWIKSAIKKLAKTK